MVAIAGEDLDDVGVEEQVRQPQRRERQQPQSPVRPLVLGRALRVARAASDARGICSTQPRLIHRRGDHHSPTDAHLNAPSLIAHRPPGTGRAAASLAPTREHLRPRRHTERASSGPMPGRTPQSVSRLDATYRRLARSWPVDELAARYRAAHLRGASDLPPGEPPPDRPLALLATAVPRLISLAVAANVLHILPTAATGRAAIAGELLSTIDMTATGSLHRCHLALDASGQDTGVDTAEEWMPYIYDEAAHALHSFSPRADPPSLIQHAQEAGRYTAIALGLLDGDATRAPEAISDGLAHVLTVCMFADIAAGKPNA